jgi:hypothetical protein
MVSSTELTFANIDPGTLYKIGQLKEKVNAFFLRWWTPPVFAVTIL